MWPILPFYEKSDTDQPLLSTANTKEITANSTQSLQHSFSAKILLLISVFRDMISQTLDVNYTEMTQLKTVSLTYVAFCQYYLGQDVVNCVLVASHLQRCALATIKHLTEKVIFQKRKTVCKTKLKSSQRVS